MQKIKGKIIDFLATSFMGVLIYLDDIIDTIVTVGVTFLVCVILTNFFYVPVKVKGTSMYPTLYDKAYGISSILERRTKGINRFDIVIIHLDDRDDDLVKRVIGLPNETISFVNDTLYINGTPFDEYYLDEEYVKEMTENNYYHVFTYDFTYTLGEDEYFCMGDNRQVSNDSRLYGPFSSKQITSIGVFVLFPFENFGSAE